MARALLSAARCGFVKIMRCILQKDDSVMTIELSNEDVDDSEQPDCTKSCVLLDAMTEGLSCLFEVCNCKYV